MTEIVGRLAIDCGRYVLRYADGLISNKFGSWETREDIAGAILKEGLVLLADGSVVRK